MSLIHYVKPFLDLGICKEYSMARKTAGTVIHSRQEATRIACRRRGFSGECERGEMRLRLRRAKFPAMQQQRQWTRELEEEIRHRAYELYLQRRAKAEARQRRRESGLVHGRAGDSFAEVVRKQRA